LTSLPDLTDPSMTIRKCLLQANRLESNHHFKELKVFAGLSMHIQGPVLCIHLCDTLPKLDLPIVENSKFKIPHQNSVIS
jgi:hypothetical protein